MKTFNELLAFLKDNENVSFENSKKCKLFENEILIGKFQDVYELAKFLINR
jgi:hypothetical protein